MKVVISVALLVLVNWTATSAFPANVIRVNATKEQNARSAVMNYIDGAEQRFARSKCDTFDSESDWNEYCNSATETVLTCPSVPSAEFYHRHCALDLTVRTLKVLPQSSFRTRATAVATVERVFTNIPTEMCGTSPSSYCERATHVCDRSEDPRGICVLPRTMCFRHAHPEKCIASKAPIYRFKADLMTFLDQTEWIESQQDDAPEDILDGQRAHGPNVSEQPMEEPAELSSSRLTVFVVVGIIASCAVLVLVLAIVVYRRPKAPKKRTSFLITG